MGNYADIKSKRFVKFLGWLERNKDAEVTIGGNHNYKVTCIQTNKSFPIPSSHSTINKYIVKDFRKWLNEKNICTEEEFDKNL